VLQNEALGEEKALPGKQSAEVAQGLRPGGLGL